MSYLCRLTHIQSCFNMETPDIATLVEGTIIRLTERVQSVLKRARKNNLRCSQCPRSGMAPELTFQLTGSRVNMRDGVHAFRQEHAVEAVNAAFTRRSLHASSLACGTEPLQPAVIVLSAANYHRSTLPDCSRLVASHAWTLEHPAGLPARRTHHQGKSTTIFRKLYKQPERRDGRLSSDSPQYLRNARGINGSQVSGWTWCRSASEGSHENDSSQ